jgi:hypothetical protein
MSDEEFVARFERLEIPGCKFRHADHVRLAWIYLRPAGLAPGAARFAEQFGRFVDHVGARGKFHETITWFYLAIINERIARGRAGTWSDFARDNADLLDPTMKILAESYRPEVLDSPVARQVFLLPRGRGEGGAA